MTQKQRSLALLVGVFLLAASIGGYAWFGVYQVEQTKQRKQEASDTLFGFKKEQVQTLSVTAKGQTVEASRHGQEWTIDRPIKTAGDNFALDTIADKLAGLKQKRDIGEQSNLADYGLDNPKIKVVATLDNGSRAELDIGGDNAFDNTIYAKREGSQRVAIVDSSTKFPLDKGLFDLRDKRVLSIEDADLKHLDVATPLFAYGLDHQPDGKWMVTSPEVMPADSARSAQILSAIRSLRALRFAADQASQADLVRFGLDKPSHTVKIQLGKNTQRTLTFATIKDGTTEHAYVKVADEPFIAEVSTSILKDLDATLVDLRDKTIFNFDTALVQQVKFTAGSESFEARKQTVGDASAESWVLVGGAAGPAKKWKLTSLLSALHDLKGSSILSEKASTADLAKAGLDKPLKTITVVGDANHVLAKLLIGKTDQSKTYVMADGSPRLFQVEAYKVSNAPSTPTDLIEAPPAVATDAGLTGPSTSSAAQQ